MSEFVIAATDENFEELVGCEGVALIDFWAGWCGPCRMIAPVVGEVAEEMNDQVKVIKVNVDECEQTAEKYKILSIPTIMIMKDGAEQERIVGYRTKEQLITALKKYLNNFTGDIK